MDAAVDSGADGGGGGRQSHVYALNSSKSQSI